MGRLLLSRKLLTTLYGNRRIFAERDYQVSDCIKEQKTRRGTLHLVKALKSREAKAAAFLFNSLGFVRDSGDKFNPNTKKSKPKTIIIFYYFEVATTKYQTHNDKHVANTISLSPHEEAPLSLLSDTEHNNSIVLLTVSHE
jgi:hypothetical protein